MKKDYQEMINNYQGGDLDLSGCNIKTLELSFVSIPSTHMLPSVGDSRALICLANVDLPDPLCPNMAINCPCSISRETWSTAVFTFSTLSSSSLIIYSNVRSFACTIPIIVLFLFHFNAIPLQTSTFHILNSL